MLRQYRHIVFGNSITVNFELGVPGFHNVTPPRQLGADIILNLSR
jgi:hypothetical protein